LMAGAMRAEVHLICNGATAGEMPYRNQNL
jgi:hypothetical protein